MTHCVWQGSQVLAEHNGSTGAVLTDYVYSGSRMIAKVASGSTQYFLSDRLSTRLVLDSNGNVSGRMAHLPFGEDFAESGTQEKHHFTSYERDNETTSDYAVNRFYAQAVARFQQVDPSYYSFDSASPQSMNRFSYSLLDPVNLRDPLGLTETDLDEDAEIEFDDVGTFEECQDQLRAFLQNRGFNVAVPSLEWTLIAEKAADYMIGRGMLARALVLAVWWYESTFRDPIPNDPGNVYGPMQIKRVAFDDVESNFPRALGRLGVTWGSTRGDRTSTTFTGNILHNVVVGAGYLAIQWNRVENKYPRKQGDNTGNVDLPSDVQFAALAGTAYQWPGIAGAAIDDLPDSRSGRYRTLRIALKGFKPFVKCVSRIVEPVPL